MNSTDEQHIYEFLKLRHLAVAGISRTNKPGNAIFDKLVKEGYHVSGIHPTLTDRNGHPCYPSLLAMPERPDGLFLITRPDLTESLTLEAVKAGVRYIWMHNMTGIYPGWGAGITAKTSSVSESAADVAREAGCVVIAGSCPMQHLPSADIAHRCLRWINERAGS
ncbi:MAG: CoA-binding protein [Bacteroidetes bacterium]|nr:CoA-binding protein [Bacteroidota bacterium]MCH8524655.1 CoA-binding protein [Balneolales bacterium]